MSRRWTWQVRLALERARWVLAALALGALVVWACRGGIGAKSSSELAAAMSWVARGREQPLIFIGGMARSGTTLMRSILDAHPDVRCGQETRIVPGMLQMGQYWMRSQNDTVWQEKLGVSKMVLDNAIAAFSLEVISGHGESAPRLCNKDPLELKMGTYILELFPKSKFIFMIRDGRACAHSIVSRKAVITGFDFTSYRQSLLRWNLQVGEIYEACEVLGLDKCLLVRYEELVLRAEETLRRVAAFLDLPWHDAMLHHEQFINKGVAISDMELSADQVVRSVNRDALEKWVGHIPADVRADMADLAPMLSVLGYDPWANPPRYETLPAHQAASLDLAWPESLKSPPLAS